MKEKDWGNIGYIKLRCSCHWIDIRQREKERKWEKKVRGEISYLHYPSLRLFHDD